MTGQPDSETRGASPSGLPLFYRDVVPLDTNQHGDLRLDRSRGFSFAAGVNAIPISLAEFSKVAPHYPIVFTGTDPMPVAVVGFRDGENLFLNAEGQWRAGCYIPAYLRTFPFIFIQDDKTGGLYLGMERAAELLNARRGTPLFQRGKPSDALNEIIQVCTAYRDDLIKTRAYGVALRRAGLLEDKEAVMNFAKGGTARLEGFRLIAEATFDTLPDKTLLDWRRKGWLKPTYNHLLSMDRWVSLMDIATEVMNART